MTMRDAIENGFRTRLQCRSAPIASAALVLMLAASSGLAQTDDETASAPDGDQLRTVVRQLEHPSWAQREAATRKLSEIVDENVNALYVFLEDSRMSPEQRYRLLQVYGDKLINRPRGALGISMDPRPGRIGEGVTIIALVPGMPAEKVLSVGDRIRRIAGAPIHSMDDLRWAVQTKRPGDLVLLTIDRPKVDENGLRVFDANNELVYETMQVEFELGSLDELNEINGGRVDTTTILQQRQQQVAEAIEMFGPPVREIVVRNKEAMIQAMVDGPGQGTDVDDHPIIRAMLQDVERIVRGNRPITPTDIDRWNAFQRQLSLEYRQAGLSREEKAYLFKVIKRFLDLRPSTADRDMDGRIDPPDRRPNR